MEIRTKKVRRCPFPFIYLFFLKNVIYFMHMNMLPVCKYVLYVCASSEGDIRSAGAESLVMNHIVGSEDWI